MTTANDGADPYDEDTPARRLRLTPADEIDIEPVVWAWEETGEGRIPAGEMSIAAGREGTGKSSFGLWLAAHITRGTLPGSFYGTPRNVFYVAVEDSWKHTLGPRLIAAGADRSMVFRIDVLSREDDEMTLSLPSDNSMLADAIREYRAAMVVIDPLMSVVNERIDTHRSRDVRTALDPLVKIAHDTGAVLLGIAHFNKASGTDISNLITGSGAFKDVPRAVFGFARDTESEDGSRVMTQSKNSLGREDLPSLSYTIENAEIDSPKGTVNTGKFLFTGQSERSVNDILGDSPTSAEDRDERKACLELMEGYLMDEGGEAPANDCLKHGMAAGFSKDTVKRCKGKRIKSAKSGGSWVWQLVITDD